MGAAELVKPGESEFSRATIEERAEFIEQFATHVDSVLGPLQSKEFAWIRSTHRGSNVRIDVRYIGEFEQGQAEMLFGLHKSGDDWSIDEWFYSSTAFEPTDPEQDTENVAR